jgi:hypothetical protein
MRTPLNPAWGTRSAGANGVDRQATLFGRNGCAVHRYRVREHIAAMHIADVRSTSEVG